MGERRQIARAAGAMSAATLMSRVLGYARDMLIAFHLGATGLSDTFFVAFRIPNLLRELLAEGSMASAVVPVLTEYQEKDPRSARELVRVVLGFLLVVVGAVCMLGIFFAPHLVTLIAPGFLVEPGKFSSTVLHTRVMFPFLLFVSLAALTMGALNTRRVFFVPALAPAVLNVTIIVTVFVLAGRVTGPIMAVSMGVALGGLMQFAVQCPAFLRQGYKLNPRLDFGDPGLRKILTLVLPVILGTAVAQINIVVSNILASYLPEGSITYLFYSMRLIQFPIGVFGVAMGMAVLPSLSGHVLRGDTGKLREDFAWSLRLLLFICIPCMAGLIALREPIVNLLFQRGQFGYDATRGTAEALLFYSLGIWAVAGVKVTAGAFYSMRDTRTPVKIAVAALTVNIVLSVALMGPMRHSGLALANALSSIVNFTLLYHLLRRRLGGLESRTVLGSAARTLTASVAMALVAGLAAGGDVWNRSGEILHKSGVLGGTILLAVATFAVLSRLMGSEELSFMIQFTTARFRRGRP